MKILCIIPARSGSKGIKNKNIQIVNGKPLMVWSILQARQSKYNSSIKIIVSTDSPIYKEIAIGYGAECPFTRPQEISQDLSTDYECVKHCIDWLKDNQNYEPDIILQLRPTQPCRKVVDIDKCLDLFIKVMNEYDSLRTIIPTPKSPYKMYSMDGNNLVPLFDDERRLYNKCRQALPKTYLHNGYIDIIKTSCVLEKRNLSGKIYGVVMDSGNNIDIDYLGDLNNAEFFFTSC